MCGDHRIFEPLAAPLIALASSNAMTDAVGWGGMPAPASTRRPVGLVGGELPGTGHRYCPLCEWRENGQRLLNRCYPRRQSDVRRAADRRCGGRAVGHAAILGSCLCRKIRAFQYQKYGPHR
jgi:hypothetical protein